MNITSNGIIPCFRRGLSVMKKTKMLKKNYEFKEVLSKGKYYSGEYVEAFIKKNNNLDYNFLGIAISSKVAKAVGRNYIKRLIRENYKEMEENIKSGNKIIFLWKKKKDSREASFIVVRQDMKKIFDKADLFEEIK